MMAFSCEIFPSVCMMDCSASSLRSALKVLSSVSSAVNAPLVSAAPSELPVAPLSKPWPWPEVYEVSALSTFALSSVKSRSMRIFVASETSAIKSAGCMRVCTNFLAASTERSICSGSIPEKSKNSSIKRRSRAFSADGLSAAERSRAVSGAAPETVASAAPAVANSSTFSKSNVEMFWRLPSSRRVKSSFFRTRTRLPFLSRTTTLTRTSSEVTCTRYCGCCACGVCGAFCAKAESEALSSKIAAIRNARVFMSVDIVISKAEPRQHSDAPHVPDRRHFPIGQRIHDGVDGGEVRGVENVGSLNAKLQRARFLYGDGLAQVHIKNDLSGPFDGVAPGITERSAIRICADARGSGPSGQIGRAHV